MKITVIIPHYCTGKMTAFAVSKLLKHSTKHDLRIIVVDNSPHDRSIEFLTKTSLHDHVHVVTRNPDMMQSHGIALNQAIPYVDTEYFITAESDSFPERDDWLDMYGRLISDGVDLAGSELRLSGGRYIHPAGALYRKSNWLEAQTCCMELSQRYHYVSNAVGSEDFKYHLMVRTHVWKDLIQSPEKFGLSLTGSPSDLESRRVQYLPVCAPFHDGRGFLDERLQTYGQRTIESDSPFISSYACSPETVRRVGYEPGQWFCYWHASRGKKLFRVPTEVKWLPGRVDQQQEYTLMENGFRHLWGVTAYRDVTDAHLQDIATSKRNTVEALFESIDRKDVREFTVR